MERLIYGFHRRQLYPMSPRKPIVAGYLLILARRVPHSGERPAKLRLDARLLFRRTHWRKNEREYNFADCFSVLLIGLNKKLADDLPGNVNNYTASYRYNGG